MRLGFIGKFANVFLNPVLVALISGVIAFGVMSPVFAFASSDKGKSFQKDRRKSLDRVIHLAGIDQAANKIDSMLFGQRFDQSGLPSEQFILLQNVMSRVFDAEAWLKSIRNRMLANYKPHYTGAVLKWYESPLGKKVVRAEIQDLAQGMTKEKEAFIGQLKIFPPQEDRLEMAERFEEAIGITNYTMDTVLMFVKVLIPFNGQFQGKSPRTISNNLREDLQDSMREQILQSILYKFRHLSDKEFSKYVNFVTSQAGRWFFRSYFRGSRDAMGQTTLKLEKLLDRIVREMESGDGESELLKEIAPPGQRFIFVRKRDPFVPLVDPKEGFIQVAEKDDTEIEFTKFSDELKRLPPIPLEVYRTIQKTDPKLFTQLEYYGGFFKQETKLASLPEGEYVEAVHKYKDLLEKANDAKPSLILTPIQTNYESLKLVGVIWKNKAITALIETGDNKGHSVNEGDLLGPNFGVVESIDQNKMSILERSRDYQGNILSQKKELEFIQESPEEG
ncbi:MAG: hypothetical protein NPINA01_19550 [Nitrospinaceae bacterium]|nr:MAG: hypothetical protein NPINA01_19550 [Nitrospinaceae bacterium]